MKQTIRIIGGLFRGKKLHFPEVEGLRPTPDRVRETLFNWLMHAIHDARCLDAFAGSGALGFEAYSRGASQVVLVEQSAAAYASLKKNASAFDSPKIMTVNGDACDYLQRSTGQFDIIFLDPPFADNKIPLCMSLLAQSNLLVDGGLLYLESAEEIILAPEIWQKIKLKHAGQVTYGLYRKSSENNHNDNSS